MATVSGRSSFRVGDRVRFDLGPRRFTGTIVEDRGALGYQGRRLFRVEIPMDPDQPMNMTLAEDEMEAVPPDEPRPSISNGDVIQFFLEGGLVSMLWSNMSGGPNQPRVWLCLDNLGNVTYTFVPERGLIGGHVPPASAMWEGKIFTPKRDEVSTFVESFGLSRKEAEQVVRKVGTAP